MEYKVLKPQYFEKFKCIGSKCEDTCCKGWNITIDRKTYKKYMKTKNNYMKGKFKNGIKRYRRSNTETEYALFDLKNGFCPFLDSKNLCEIYTELGPESMCNTCKEYPRVYYHVNGVFQKGLTLSCPESARVVLLNKEIMEFDLVEEDVDHKYSIVNIDSKDDSRILAKYFEELRIFSIAIIQNRRFTIDERLIILGLFVKSVENTSDKNSILNIINEYNLNIEKGYYDNITKTINLEQTTESQFNFILHLVNQIVGTKNIFGSNFSKDISDMINGLALDKGSLKNSRSIFIKSYNLYYKNFIKDKEYIFENYLVNYIFINNFPYNLDDNIKLSYSYLIINYIIIKLILIGMCAYYDKEMSIDKFVYLIQNYSRSMLHDNSLNNKIYKYLEEYNVNTINHMILMIGK